MDGPGTYGLPLAKRWFERRKRYGGQRYHPHRIRRARMRSRPHGDGGSYLPAMQAAEKEGTGGNKPKSDLTQYNVCHENDLLVNCMNVVSGAAGVSRYYGAISPVYYAFYPHKDENIWYYHYIFRLLPFQRSLVGLGKGILMHESEDGTLTSVRMRISKKEKICVTDNFAHTPE